MRILGIDTATSTVSVALVEDERLVGQRIYPEKAATGQTKKNHAEVLVPLIDAVLREAGLASGDLDRVAVSIGPGSFTGVRIGLSTAKGIAFGWAVPVIGISTLMAYANAVDGHELVCPLLDARKKEVYTALFQRQSGKLRRLTEDLVMPANEVVRQISQSAVAGACAIIGSGAQLYGSTLRDSLGGRVALVEESDGFCVAAAVARLAGDLTADPRDLDGVDLVPLYVRASEAELKRPRAANLSN